MERYIGIILIVIVAFFARDILTGQNVYANFANNGNPAILSEATQSAIEVLPVNQPVTTQSSFVDKLEDETEVIPKKTVYQDDPETEAGEEKILDEGEDGKITKIFKITYSKDGEEYARELVSTDTIPTKDKKIVRGTKIVWRTLDTPDGEIKYWKHLRVYATDYDSHCLGCDDWTAIGMHQGKGVIAVDPKVIPLRSKLYVNGYGMAVAGDTGGAIKGNIIDLGFDDAKTSGWSSRFVDIYLL